MITSNIIADLCIYILTWNVGTHYPDDISLMNMLSLNGTTSCPENKLPDIYVIGLQEVNTQPKNQFVNIFKDDQWTLKVKEQLNNLNYAKVETESLQGILIMLFAKYEHTAHMKDIETEHTRTGLGGLWGNKGAVSIRMSLYGTGVTFVSAHLAAHDEHLKERIVDYNQIVNNHHYTIPNYKTIFDHDFVFWFGDLNFRLKGTDSAWDIRNAIEQGRIDELIQNDQLLEVRRSGNAFALLEEQLPTFPPTFKFEEGTNDYNLKRRPAWCDRILYRVQSDKYPSINLSITQLSYKSHPDYTLSDHRPVSAEFSYKIEAQSQTDDEVYEMTHSGTTTTQQTPLASVIILFSLIISRTYSLL